MTEGTPEYGGGNLRPFPSPLRDVPKTPSSGDGGGTDDVIDKLKVIEERLGNIEAEQRTHLRWMITTLLGRVPWSGVTGGVAPRSPAWAGLVSLRVPAG
jgi:hypothetical protein